MSIRYYNQTAPFWDFVASFEDHSSRAGGAAAANMDAPDPPEYSPANPPQPPTERAWGSFPFMFGGPRGGGGAGGGGHHRGRGGRHHHHGRHHSHHRGGHPHDVPPPPQPNDQEVGSSESSDESGSDVDTPGHEHHHAGPHHGHGARHGPPPHGRGRHRGPGERGGRGRGRGRHHGFPFGGPMSPLAGLAEMFQSQFFGGAEGAAGGEEGTRGGRKDESFRPDVDVFDTPEMFVVHVSLSGAKKEDVAVNWDAEKSALSIAGVIFRPGDEELLSSLALDERSVGHFDRKVHLGSRAHPAQVDVDGIVAKLEDGVLRVNVPKLDSGYVEIKKVDVE